ncbi:hypothetical protein [Labrys neptuniae]
MPGIKGRSGRRRDASLEARDNMILAAVKRGVALSEIARGTGVSDQRIGQIVRKNESKNGRICRQEKGSSLVGSTGDRRISHIKHFKVCNTCKNTFEVKTIFNNKFYCSQKCHGLSRRIISDSDISLAIDMRIQGSTWTHVARIFKRDSQVVQKRIWMYLVERNNLKKIIVRKIWLPSNGLKVKSGKWDWLVKSTGHTPE